MYGKNIFGNLGDPVTKKDLATAVDMILSAIRKTAAELQRDIRLTQASATNIEHNLWRIFNRPR